MTNTLSESASCLVACAVVPALFAAPLALLPSTYTPQTA